MGSNRAQTELSLVQAELHQAQDSLQGARSRLLRSRQQQETMEQDCMAFRDCDADTIPGEYRWGKALSLSLLLSLTPSLPLSRLAIRAFFPFSFGAFSVSLTATSSAAAYLQQSFTPFLLRSGGYVPLMAQTSNLGHLCVPVVPVVSPSLSLSPSQHLRIEPLPFG